MKTHPKVVVDLIKQYADNGIGAEIGVFQGDTSAHILDATNTKMLYMVDQYKRNFDTKRRFYTTTGNPEQDCANVKKRFTENYPDRHKLIIKSSKEAAEELDICFDFIFIDANHTYEYVLEDMNLWIPKVKPGGLVMGHDWWRKFKGVEQAVIQYTKDHPLFLPENARPQTDLPRKTKYCLAPYGKSCILKSYPEGHVWWGIKK